MIYPTEREEEILKIERLAKECVCKGSGHIPFIIYLKSEEMDQEELFHFLFQALVEAKKKEIRKLHFELPFNQKNFEGGTPE